MTRGCPLFLTSGPSVLRCPNSNSATAAGRDKRACMRWDPDPAGAPSTSAEATLAPQSPCVRPRSRPVTVLEKHCHSVREGQENNQSIHFKYMSVYLSLAVYVKALWMKKAEKQKQSSCQRRFQLIYKFHLITYYFLHYTTNQIMAEIAKYLRSYYLYSTNKVLRRKQGLVLFPAGSAHCSSRRAHAKHSAHGEVFSASLPTWKRA